MNIDYLYSIINLYLKKEKANLKINLNMRNDGDKITFKFNMDKDDPNKTDFSLPYDEVNQELVNILKTIKQNQMIIDEKYQNKQSDYHYSVLFQNGRSLSFDGFSLVELNNIRNILYDIQINSSELRLTDLNQERKMAYTPLPKLQQAGFASYTTLFLVALFLTDVFIIALWVFKVLTE